MSSTHWIFQLREPSRCHQYILGSRAQDKIFAPALLLRLFCPHLRAKRKKKKEKLTIHWIHWNYMVFRCNCNAQNLSHAKTVRALSNQCTVFNGWADITCGFILDGSHHQEYEWIIWSLFLLLTGYTFDTEVFLHVCLDWSWCIKILPRGSQNVLHF